MILHSVQSLFPAQLVSHKIGLDAGRWHGPNPITKYKKVAFEIGASIISILLIIRRGIHCQNIFFDMFYRLLHAMNSSREY